jgi:flagellar hook protein FlgE
MMRSFFNAVTGLNAYRTWMDITSDNLSNVNTIGFKGSRPLFQDAISSVTIGLNTVTNTMKSTTYGAGILVDSTQKLWTIGNFKQTGVNTDLAVQGRGLFIIKDPIGGTAYYTRDGQFRLSRDGFMVNSGGLKLQGFKVDEKGKTVGTGLEDIHVVPQLPPKTTSTITFLQPSNLNADAGVPAVDFEPTDPSSYNYKYTLTIYDSLGTPYQADLFFRRTETPSTWEIYLRSDIDPATAGYELYGNWTTTRVNFDPFGKLIYDNVTVLREPTPDGKSYLYYLDPGALTVPATTPSGGTFPDRTDWRVYVGETPQTGAPDPGDPISNSYITQYSADFIITADQNGYAKGDLVDVYVLSEDGAVVGVYSNGKSLPLYRVAIAVFSDPEGGGAVGKGANSHRGRRGSQRDHKKAL